MELVAAASLITAFVAGMAALFAPCCIGVLLPSYLASVFKTKTEIFLMTFVYYLGLLTIFMPLGFGAAGLTARLAATALTAGAAFFGEAGLVDGVFLGFAEGAWFFARFFIAFAM